MSVHSDNKESPHLPKMDEAHEQIQIAEQPYTIFNSRAKKMDHCRSYCDCMLFSARQQYLLSCFEYPGNWSPYIFVVDESDPYLVYGR